MGKISKDRKNRNGVYFADKSLVWTVGIYIRLSVADGNDVSLSVKNQKSIIGFFMEHEFKERYEIYKIYIDDGASGTTDKDRMSFMEMVRDIEDGKINCIVSKTLSRVFRNYSDQGYFLEEFFPRMGVRFITIESPRIDTFADPGILHGYEIPLNGIVNDRYAEATSAAVRQTFKNMRQEGKFQGGFPPYGYLRDPQDKHSFIIDEEAAEIVRQIFIWYVYKRFAIEAIKNRLNSLGIPNPSGYKKEKGLKYVNPGVKGSSSFSWTAGTVRMILTNRTYLGEMVQGRSKVISYKVHRQIQVPSEHWDIVRDRHEPIIKKEIFDKAQELLALNRSMKSYGSEVSVLSGFIYCADCGRKMHKRKSGAREYYACSTYYKRCKEDCTPHFIKKELIEAAVIKAISEEIKRSDIDSVIMEVMNTASDTASSYKEEILKRSEAEIKALSDRAERLYMDYNRRVITEEEYLKYRACLNRKQENLKKAFAILQEEMKKDGGKHEIFQKKLEELRKNKEIKKLDRMILEEMVDRIYIDKNKNITVIFRFGRRNDD